MSTNTVVNHIWRCAFPALATFKPIILIENKWYGNLSLWAEMKTKKYTSEDHFHRCPSMNFWLQLNCSFADFTSSVVHMPVHLSVGGSNRNQDHLVQGLLVIQIPRYQQNFWCYHICFHQRFIRRPMFCVSLVFNLCLLVNSSVGPHIHPSVSRIGTNSWAKMLHIWPVNLFMG